MNAVRNVLGSVILGLASIAQAGQLSSFDNQYTAKLYGFSVTVTSRLNPKPNNLFEFYFNADAALGSVTEISQFSWDEQENRAIPQTYSYNRSGLGNSRNYALVFDWTKNIVINQKTNTTFPISAEHKIQDELSYQLQLRQDLMAGKSKLKYAITNGKKIKDYQFEVVGEEVLETPLGKVDTIKIKRTQANDNRETYAWFAKNFQYLLVRLQQEENGSAYTIYISKASLNGKAIDHF